MLVSKSTEHWTRYVEDQLLSSGVYFGHGTDNALDEAAWLVLHVLEQPLDGSFDDWSSPVSLIQGAAIKELLKQRIKTRKPLAYLLGEAWFCGLRFEVDESVLVPRSPLAELVFHGFEPWLNSAGSVNALDLCTGSGCIGIAMAHYHPGWQVTASDISPHALAMAGRNCQLHELTRRVSLVESDLFENLPEQRFDLVVSNPPYVAAPLMNDMPAEYQTEPELGLISGEDGLDIPLRILVDAPAWLTDHGVLVCEVGSSAQTLQEILPVLPLTWLEFEHGGEGVFTIDRQPLVDALPAIESVLENRKNVI